ncbi:MAG: winged helix-turn-helix domain-containing protein [archaeon]
MLNQLKDGIKSTITEPLNGPLNKPLNEPLNEPLNKIDLILNYIFNHPMCKRKDISKNTNISLGALKRNLQKLIDNNKIQKIGSDKTGGYIVKK